jgi:hypothetical protein
VSVDEVDVLDVTDLVLQYRLLLRAIWNEHVWACPALRCWDAVEQFNELRPVLYDRLLLAKLKAIQGISLREPVELRIVPSIPDSEGHACAPVRISESSSSAVSRRWDQPPGIIRPSDMDLLFVDFFDWSQIGYWDLRYFRVRIVKSHEYGHLVGREALIECDSARVRLLRGQGEQGRPDGSQCGSS